MQCIFARQTRSDNFANFKHAIDSNEPYSVGGSRNKLDKLWVNCEHIRAPSNRHHPTFDSPFGSTLPPADFTEPHRQKMNFGAVSGG